MKLHPDARHFLHGALLLLVLAGVGHIHGHLHRDGLDTVDLVHFENFGGHPEHSGDGNHADVEKELLPQALLTKVPTQNDMLFLLSFSLLHCQRPSKQRQACPVFDERARYHRSPPLLPPLRAPPSLAS
ncbi:MAG: hypothetical protein RQ899_04335 [Pseudomonadales bacterium]|nr:hypothetical protein [Pseudomonadales bacterium]